MQKGRELCAIHAILAVVVLWRPAHPARCVGSRALLHHPGRRAGIAGRTGQRRADQALKPALGCIGGHRPHPRIEPLLDPLLKPLLDEGIDPMPSKAINACLQVAFSPIRPPWYPLSPELPCQVIALPRPGSARWPPTGASTGCRDCRSRRIGAAPAAGCGLYGASAA